MHTHVAMAQNGFPGARAHPEVAYSSVPLLTPNIINLEAIF